MTSHTCRFCRYFLKHAPLVNLTVQPNKFEVKKIEAVLFSLLNDLIQLASVLHHRVEQIFRVNALLSVL